MRKGVHPASRKFRVLAFPSISFCIICIRKLRNVNSSPAASSAAVVKFSCMLCISSGNNSTPVTIWHGISGLMQLLTSKWTWCDSGTKAFLSINCILPPGGGVAAGGELRYAASRSIARLMKNLIHQIWYYGAQGHRLSTPLGYNSKQIAC